MSAREAMMALRELDWNDTTPFGGAENGVDLPTACLEAADSILNCLGIAFDPADHDQDIRNVHVQQAIRGTQLLIALAGVSIKAGANPEARS